MSAGASMAWSCVCWEDPVAIDDTILDVGETPHCTETVMGFIRLSVRKNEVDKVNREAQVIGFDAFQLLESVNFGPDVTHVYLERWRGGSALGPARW
jgi:hypothetical protein